MAGTKRISKQVKRKILLALPVLQTAPRTAPRTAPQTAPPAALRASQTAPVRVIPVLQAPRRRININLADYQLPSYESIMSFKIGYKYA